jgi:hypothetical protein
MSNPIDCYRNMQFHIKLSKITNSIEELFKIRELLDIPEITSCIKECYNNLVQ